MIYFWPQCQISVEVSENPIKSTFQDFCWPQQKSDTEVKNQTIIWQIFAKFYKIILKISFKNRLLIMYRLQLFFYATAMVNLQQIWMTLQLLQIGLLPTKNLFQLHTFIIFFILTVFVLIFFGNILNIVKLIFWYGIT